MGTLVICILLLCILGCIAIAQDNEGFVLIVLVLIMVTCLVATAFAADHTCGGGHQYISVRSDACCACKAANKPRRTIDDEYQQVAPPPADGTCCDCPAEVQEWSDWPECAGAKRLDEAEFVK